ncbi:MAG: anti-sigma factor [Bacteroidota bacterium]
MNVTDYISSGILELYVSGSLPAEERTEVERMANLYPEVQAEIQAIESAVAVFANTYQQAAPPAILDKVFDAIDTEDKAPEKPEPKLVSLRPTEEEKSSGFPWKWMAAAACVALLISVVFNFYQQNLLSEKDQTIAVLESSNRSLAIENQVVKEQLDVLDQPDQKLILLAGTDKYPNVKARIYWNVAAEKTWLRIDQLPAPPSDKQYQLWAIIDGQPVSAGVFNLEDGPIAMEDIGGNVAAFAVTLEQKGGSEVPTLEEMYLIGNV